MVAGQTDYLRGTLGAQYKRSGFAQVRPLPRWVEDGGAWMTLRI